MKIVSIIFKFYCTHRIVIVVAAADGDGGGRIGRKIGGNKS
jgi:hypothetical protein